MDDLLRLAESDADDVKNVIDDAADDDAVPQTRFEITSYGADFDVSGLVNRLRKGDIFIPPFQRGYVWNLKEASRFIESLLLGLPVPGVFLARDPKKNNKLLVIDGQQRLKTLLFFFDGVFNPKPEERLQRPFRLWKVGKALDGASFEKLHESDRVQLENYIIHATIIRQESPPNDDTAIFHVFERINTAGTRLAAQEIRVAVYHGKLLALVEQMNAEKPWREIYGKKSARLKDRELILRFLALHDESDKYERPFSEFLTKFVARHRDPEQGFLDSCRERFRMTIATANKALGSRAFRPEGTLNAAVFDSVMIGLARRLVKGKVNADAVKTAYDALVKDADYQKAVSRATADQATVETRLALATNAFANVA
jgi:hypothetical protein